MIFALTADAVLSGRKTCTTRRGECRYRVGRSYGVQRGRGLLSEGRILIERVEWVERAGDVNQETAAAEGFGSPAEFRAAYAKLHGPRALDLGAWRIWFKLIEGGKDAADSHRQRRCR